MSFCVITHPIGQNGRAVCKKHGNHVAIADKSWIRVLDTRTPSCYGCAAPPGGRIEAKDVRPSVRMRARPSGFAFTTRLVGQKFRAVCTATYVTVIHGNHSVFRDLSLRAVSWLLFARQTSDLFDKESF